MSHLDNSTMNPLRVMVVGVGALGKHHARILAGMDGVDLVAVADPREEIGRQIAADFDADWVADYRSAISGVDAASIVVPTSLHLPVAREFLQRGIPVLVEKPLTANVVEAEQLVELSHRHDAILQVGHIERFNPAMQAARHLCRDPRYIRTERVSPFPFRSTDIGVIHDLLIHDLDLVLSLVKSPVESVDAIGTRVVSHHEDVVNARLRFRNGCVADLTASRVHPSAHRTMQLWSATKSVSIDFHSREVTAFSPDDSLLAGFSPVDLAMQPGADIEQLKKDIFGRFIRSEQPEVNTGSDALTAELSEFVECIRAGGTPSCDGVAGLAAVELAGRVLQSLDDNSWGVRSAEAA